ncbi:zinc finger protein 32 [Drosophila madeirensis]|uniref:Zinc finger protein 32 n=1 Tax=Drosophila madeirensis TaxID=30013 RepID=A0AAU9G037_DROMD
MVGKMMAKTRDKNETERKSDILRHMCEYCGYRTRIRGNLMVHKRRHTGEKPFSCDTCQAKFAARYQLNTHRELHLDVKLRRSRHMCKDCNVGFLSARALYHHRPLHGPGKRFKCSQCDKSYAQAAGYAQHKRWHRQRNQRATAESSIGIKMNLGSQSQDNDAASVNC